MLNNKGITLIEVLVSVALTSIVLIFLMNLFVKTRALYNTSKTEAQADVLKSTIIKTISDDLLSFGYDSYTDNGIFTGTRNGRKITIKFKTGSTKVLQIYKVKSKSYINYGGSSGVVREIPKNLLLDENISEFIKVREENNNIEFKIPLTDTNGNNYNINIYAIK